jgi:hypothetical protein
MTLITPTLICTKTKSEFHRKNTNLQFLITLILLTAYLDNSHQRKSLAERDSRRISLSYCLVNHTIVLSFVSFSMFRKSLVVQLV